MSENNMNSMSKICGIPIRIINMIYEIPNLSQADKDFVIKYDRKFTFFDMTILYIITLIMITNNIVLLFLINSIDTPLAIKIVKAECYFLISFGIILLMTRIWNDKFYMLEPILNHWIVYKPNRAIIKCLFFFTILTGMIGIGSMIAVVGLLSENKITEAIILTTVSYIIFIICSLFYRIHAGSYIYDIIKMYKQPQIINTITEPSSNIYPTQTV